jgi:RHS repeat-associated protein
VASPRYAAHILTHMSSACRVSTRPRARTCAARLDQLPSPSSDYQSNSYPPKFYAGHCPISSKKIKHIDIANVSQDGQRVFKSEPQTAQTLPNETVLGTSFTDWLKKNFQWLYATAQTNATLGTSYSYGEAGIPSWAITGEYGNGGAKSTGRTEYIWLPTDDGSAIPVAIFRNNRYFNIHSDHLGTPRLVTDDTAKPVWQWAYSAFGDNKPTGVLKVTTNPNTAFTSAPLLAATNPAVVLHLRFPGQYADSETGLFYNYYRTYQASQGRYTQADPIGLDGGWNRFGYVDGNSLMATDPYGLFELPSIPQPVLDFSTGVADAASLGLGPLARNALGIDGGVDQCSDAYSAGQWSSLALGGGRVLYAGVARAGSVAAANGAAAMSFRNGLKRVMRGPLAGSDFRIKNYAELLQKYGSDDAIRAAAGRTSPAFNSVGANLAIGGAAGRATCGCPR